jgi:hypothetical protein
MNDSEKELREIIESFHVKMLKLGNALMIHTLTPNFNGVDIFQYYTEEMASTILSWKAQKVEKAIKNECSKCDKDLELIKMEEEEAIRHDERSKTIKEVLVCMPKFVDKNNLPNSEDAIKFTVAYNQALSDWRQAIEKLEVEK